MFNLFQKFVGATGMLIFGVIYLAGAAAGRAFAWRGGTGLILFVVVGVGLTVVELVSAAIEPPMEPWELAVKEGRSYVPPCCGSEILRR
jgi:hypothetical protein